MKREGNKQKAKSKRQELKGSMQNAMVSIARTLTVYLTPFAFCVLPFVAFCLLMSTRSQAQDNALPPMLRGVDIEQRLNESVPLDLVFRDESGRAVLLKEYFTGKPVILTLVYYECPMLCTQVLNGLVSALKVLTFNAGDQFNIITVSFNPREIPALAAAKKAAYLQRYARPGAATGWHFLTGDPAAIEAVTRAVGFHYTYDPNTGLYAHASGIMVLTPEGKISRYFYGIEYAPRDLRLGLVEASAHKIGSPIDRVLLFCYHYDPAQGKYSAIVINFIRLGGILTLFGLGTLIISLLRRDANRPRWKKGGAR